VPTAAKKGGAAKQRIAEVKKLLKQHGLSDISTPRTEGPSFISHNKFIVLLERGKAQAVWTGSTNFTESGIFGQSKVGRKRPTITAALVAANRRNAQKSTGPRTEEGKRRVMLNGLKHGFRSRSFRESLTKSGEDTTPVDRIFLFLTLYFRAQKRHEVHRIARFVQALGA